MSTNSAVFKHLYILFKQKRLQFGANVKVPKIRRSIQHIFITYYDTFDILIIKPYDSLMGIVNHKVTIGFLILSF